jgi:hypothetical protein
MKQMVPKRGTGINLVNNAPEFAAYWKEFKDTSYFDMYFSDSTDLRPVFKTKSGGMIVGGIATSKNGGHIVLLPVVRFPEAGSDDIEAARGISEEDGGDEEEEESEGEWAAEGFAFGRRLILALVQLDEQLRSAEQISPPPTWVSSPTFVLESEERLQAEVASVTTEIERLQNEREQLARLVDEAAWPKVLLYGTGHQLEGAVLQALRLIGFQAASVRYGESEFDAVFESWEGRFLGEAEGKDDKAVNIDKLSQLERNISEDFQRDDVETPAKGVLFGNGYRLTEPRARSAEFTAKCVSGAARARVALVRTSDLFPVASYLLTKTDTDFARACRNAILGAEGTVAQFPNVPRPETEIVAPAKVEADSASP